jgi:hypothetical protein
VPGYAIGEARCRDTSLHAVYVIEFGWGEVEISRELAIRALEEHVGELVATLEKKVHELVAEITEYKRHGHPVYGIVNLGARSVQK